MTVNDLRQDWIELADDLRMRLAQLESSGLLLTSDADSKKLTDDWEGTLRKWIDELNALRSRYGAE